MGGRDHSCEVCGHGGFNDPDGDCMCQPAAPFSGVATQQAQSERDLKCDASNPGPGESLVERLYWAAGHPGRAGVADLLNEVASRLEQAEAREGRLREERDEFDSRVAEWIDATDRENAALHREKQRSRRLREALEKIAGGLDGALTAPIFLPYMETAQFALDQLADQEEAGA